MADKLSLQEKLCLDAWHRFARCFLILSRIKRTGVKETQVSLARQLSDQAEKGRYVFVWIMKELNEHGLGLILEELEQRGLVCMRDDIIAITKRGRQWRSNRFEIDAFRRWLQWLDLQMRDRCVSHEAKLPSVGRPALTFLQTFFM